MRRALVAVALAACVLLLNANALGAFFIGDDFDFLRLIGARDSWLDAARLEFWGEWEPLWYVTWYADLALWGLHPFGFHLTNTAWLALAVIALYGLLRELWPEAHLAPCAAALLFATHPVHDEAVVYLAARGHVICVALLLLSTWMYARARRERVSSGERAGWFAGAFVAAFLAALTKETALILPAWIGTVELLLLGRDRSTVKAALGAAVAFVVPGACYLLLRRGVVGLESDKLAGLSADLPELADDVADDLPSYALLGGLPLPFARLHEPVIEAWRPLGWVVLAAGLAGGVALAWAARRRSVPRPAAGVWWLGIVVAVTALAPVFWADLPLRRRYLFVPTVGVALAASVLLEGLRARHRRAAEVLLAVLVLGGAAASLERHAVVRDAGRVTRNIIETVRGAPLGEPSVRRGELAAFVTLPGRWGGDAISGAYLLHHTDLASALAIFEAPQPQIHYAMRCYHADDHTAEVLETTPGQLLVRIAFRTERAFAAALREDPADEGRGDWLRAERVAVDRSARTLDYRVTLSSRSPGRPFTIYLYSDGKLEALTPGPPVPS